MHASGSINLYLRALVVALTKPFESVEGQSSRVCRSVFSAANVSANQVYVCDMSFLLPWSRLLYPANIALQEESAY